MEDEVVIASSFAFFSCCEMMPAVAPYDCAKSS